MSRDDEIDWHTWKRRAPRTKKHPIPERAGTMIEEFRGRVSCPTLITILLAFDPKLTIDDLQSRLDELGMTPTRIALYSLRQSFFRHQELLRQAGLLIERTPRATTRSTQLEQVSGHIDRRSHALRPASSWHKSAYIGDWHRPYVRQRGQPCHQRKRGAELLGGRHQEAVLGLHARYEYLRPF
jgi:hypothetical protein